MTSIIMGDVPSDVGATKVDEIALFLRIGLGLVFLTGGWWKLSRAIDPERSAALVEKYTATNGYINSFFEQYLFSGGLNAAITPLGFLIALSAFELVAGMALITGLLVRSLSFIFAFLLWGFVIALPVMTVPDMILTVKTHLSPAVLVQIRDIGLSGMCFALFSMGSGKFSLDRMIFNRGFITKKINWNHYGLLLRLSVAIVFLVGGFFYGFSHIKSFIAWPLALIIIGALLASGYFTRMVASAALLVLIWYCFGKLNLETSFWNNLNAVKREFALMAMCIVLIQVQGGRAFRPLALIEQPLGVLIGFEKHR